MYFMYFQEYLKKKRHIKFNIHLPIHKPVLRCGQYSKDVRHLTHNFSVQRRNQTLQEILSDILCYCRKMFSKNHYSSMNVIIIFNILLCCLFSMLLGNCLLIEVTSQSNSQLILKVRNSYTEFIYFK